jgi:hypothetical protein
MLTAPECLLRRTYQPGALLVDHPPVLKHPHKRLAFDVACPPGAAHGGSIEVTRWRAVTLAERVELAATRVVVIPGPYDYAGGAGSIWHVNFADPRLFVAYGSGLLAQDELQVLEHPLLGCVRQALLAEKLPALTEENLVPTPFLVTDVERRCELDTSPDLDAGRPAGLYGNRFAAAKAEVVRAAIRPLVPPSRTNLIAIAAPSGGRGAYFPAQLERILVTACTGFSAAVVESRRLWPGVPVEVRTGFWGCGAFGGNRRAMSLLQLLAARLSGVDALRFHAFDVAGEADFRAGADDLQRVLADGTAGEPLAALMERVADLDYEWGLSDGN